MSYKLESLKSAAASIVAIDLCDSSKADWHFADKLKAPTDAFKIAADDILILDDGAWRLFDDEGEARSDCHLIPPAFVTPTTVADWYRHTSRLFGIAFSDGKAAGTEAVERKVQEVGRLIFGSVLENAIAGGIRSLVRDD